MDNFEFEIDLDDFKKFENIFDKLGYEIEQAVKDGMVDLARQAENRLKENLNRFGLGSSKLASSARVEMVDDLSFRMVVDATSTEGQEYAMYVEFGTGVVGAEVPHPNTNFGDGTFSNWTYDSAGHGEYGWSYYKNNKWNWTLGQQARPFMYLTWLWIRQAGTQIIQKHINKALGGLAD